MNSTLSKLLEERSAFYLRKGRLEHKPVAKAKWLRMAKQLHAAAVALDRP